MERYFRSAAAKATTGVNGTPGTLNSRAWKFSESLVHVTTGCKGKARAPDSPKTHDGTQYDLTDDVA